MSQIKECKHKWKYIGFYNGGYYNTKECIHCGKTEIEPSKQKPLKTNGNKNTNKNTNS